VDFVGDAKLALRPGHTGATGNIYVGLHEYPEMAFVLHLLRPGDLFVDVGANVGSYTILAGAAAKTFCVSFEPSPESFEALSRNVELNGIGERVTLVRAAVGERPGRARLTSGLGPMNHIVAEGHRAEATEVEVMTLDGALGALRPTLLKIDVEGFEAEILRGASRVLQSPHLLAAIIERNEVGQPPQSGHATVKRLMDEAGFVSCSYQPKMRTLALDDRATPTGNSIYVKDMDAVRSRLAEASSFSLPGRLSV
jgi:FkbM family methyltransferase